MEFLQSNSNFVCVFDVETTGLPHPSTKYTASTLNTDLWPHIIQLAFVIVDIDSGKIIDSSNKLIKISDDVIIPEESIKVHGITKEKCMSSGFDIKNVLLHFFQAIQVFKVSKIIAHNIDFDINMVKAECYRILHDGTINKNFIDPHVRFITNLKNIDKFCTMKKNKERCKIVRYWDDGKKYHKFPSLLELYQHLFNETPSNLHDAMVDVLVCVQCYAVTECQNEVQQKLITDCRGMIENISSNNN